MTSENIEMRGRGCYIKGTRVSLDSVVYGYLGGQSPETIQHDFPSITLEQVHGAIAYYLGHKDAVDEYLKQGEAVFEAGRRAQKIPDDLRERLMQARAQIRRDR